MTNTTQFQESFGRSNRNIDKRKSKQINNDNNKYANLISSNII